MDDGEEGRIMQRSSAHTGFMVDVIDASIPAVITVGDGGLFFNHAPEFPALHRNAAQMNQQKWGNKGGGNPENLQRPGRKNVSFPHFFQSVLTRRWMVLLGDCADGLLTAELHADAHQENTYV